MGNESKPNSNGKKLLSKQAAAGAFSGFATRVVSQPLDVLKIRFQIQVEPIKKWSTRSQYVSLVQAVQTITRNEGILALWKGHNAAQALSITYGTVQFAVFESTSKFATCYFPGFTSTAQKMSLNFVCGSFAGCAATVASYPFDTARTRLVAQGEPKIYRGIFHVFLTIHRNEGFWRIYAGLSPTLLQIGPYMGIQFALYKSFIEAYDNFFGNAASFSGTKNLVCGAASGAIAKTATYPVDLSKKRLQVQGFNKKHHYHGFIDCLRKTARNEGYAGWFKGLSPSLYKAILASALHFYFYEAALRFMNS